jgi:hypothetical protein
MITPHDVFEIVRADEVAECWEGVPMELGTALWSKIVPLQERIPNLEDSGPHDHIGHANLAQYWDKLTEDEQRTLNALAERQEA